MTEVIKLKIPINSSKKLLEKIKNVLRDVLPDAELEVRYVKIGRLSIVYENSSVKQLISFNDPESVDYKLITRNLGLAKYFTLMERRKIIVKELER